MSIIMDLREELRRLQEPIKIRDEQILSLQAALRMAQERAPAVSHTPTAANSCTDIIVSVALPDPFGPSNDAPPPALTKFEVRLAAARHGEVVEAELRILKTTYPPLVPMKAPAPLKPHQQAAVAPPTTPPRTRRRIALLATACGAPAASESKSPNGSPSPILSPIRLQDPLAYSTIRSQASRQLGATREIQTRV